MSGWWVNNTHLVQVAVPTQALLPAAVLQSLQVPVG